MDDSDDDFDDEVPTDPAPLWDPDRQDPVGYASIEAQFLGDILAEPQDFALRVVYADWLEQEGRTNEAELVRLLSVDPLEGSRERARLRELAARAHNDWLATLSRGAIDGCEQELRSRCTQSWESLAATDEPRVRRCGQCGHEVRFCASLDAVRIRQTERVVYSPLLDHARARDAYDGSSYLDGGHTLRERRALRLS